MTPRSAKWGHPLLEDGGYGEVFLGVDAADTAGAVVEVVVGVEGLPLRRGLERAVLAQKGGGVGVGVGRVLERGRSAV